MTNEDFFRRFEIQIELLYLEISLSDLSDSDIMVQAALKTLLEFIFDSRKFRFSRYMRFISEDRFELCITPDDKGDLAEIIIEIWELIRKFGQTKFLRVIHLWGNRPTYADWYLELKREFFKTSRKKDRLRIKNEFNGNKEIKRIVPSAN